MTSNLMKFLIRALLGIGSLILVTAAPNARKAEPHFRSDYKYVEQHHVFIKVNTKAVSWNVARSTCEAEGASLAIIIDEPEAKTIVELMRQAAPKQTSAWIGVHDIFIENEFMTITGEPASSYYFLWSQGQPDNAHGDEDCVTIGKDGKLNDVKCATKFPFICMKNAADVSLNIKCQSHDMGYFFGSPNNNYCFKLHLKPKTWSEALQTCQHEQAQLAVIRSDAEAKVLSDKLAKHPKDSIPGNFNKDAALLGFHDQFSPGEYLTISGIPLSDSGYEKWDSGQPDNAGNNEHCGTMFRSGKLNDAPCNQKFMFFCEKNLDDPNEVAIFSRFQEDS